MCFLEGLKVPLYCCCVYLLQEVISRPIMCHLEVMTVRLDLLEQYLEDNLAPVPCCQGMTIVIEA